MISFIKNNILQSHAEQAIASAPKLEDYARQTVAAMRYGTDHQAKADLSGEEFWQFRPYTTSDRPQDIDWRQSARTDQIFTKQREMQNKRTTHLWCDNAASLHFSSSPKHFGKRASAQIMAASLALLLKQSDQHVKMAGLSGASFSYDHLTTDHHVPLATIASTPPSNTGFIGVSDFLDDDAVGNIATLTHLYTYGIIIHIFDPAEYSLPYKGRALFSPAAATSPTLIDNVSDIREAYITRRDAHIRNISTCCTQKGWIYITHITNTPISDTLTRIIQHMTQKGRLSP